MTLTRLPNERTMPLRSAIERLMDWPFYAFDSGTTELAPPIDVRETDDAYVVEIDLPGLDPANTEVFVEGRTLTIRGHYAEETERHEGNYLLRERRKGNFTRSVALPGMVDVDGVTSRFDNGQLTVSLPKASQNKARRIEITKGSQTQKSGAQVQGPAKG